MNSTHEPSRILEEHLRECDECGRSGLPVDEIGRLLQSVAVPADPALLTRRALPALTRALVLQTAPAVWRPVVLAVLVSFVPLVAVLAYDVWILQLLHALLDQILPTRFATWIVFNYAAAIVLMLGTTYAAIPLFVSKQISGSASQPRVVAG